MCNEYNAQKVWETQKGGKWGREAAAGNGFKCVKEKTTLIFFFRQIFSKS